MNGELRMKNGELRIKKINISFFGLLKIKVEGILLAQRSTNAN